MITKEEFKQMSDYFRKKYFDNIPAIPCYLASPAEFDEEKFDGRFVVQQSKDYDEDKDELMRTSGYAKRLELEDSGIGCEWGTPSWTDPLNHPDVHIVVNESLSADPMRLTGTLLHELTHYWCWYCGYGYHDGEEDYERKLKELGFPSNWDHTFNKEKRTWEDAFDYEILRPVYDDFKANAGT